MPFSVKLEQFDGPLDLLLDLIEREQLDVSKVALARVTEAYLHHVEAHPEIPPEELADFLVVATRLLLLKSQLLLPFLNLGAEEPTDDLEGQLKIYREYLEASKSIEAQIGRKRFLFVHDRLPSVDIGFAPPKKLGTDQMRALMLAVVRRLEPVFTVPQATVERIVSIHERIGHLRSLVRKAERLSFREVLGSAESRVDIVISFLALLELVKQRSVAVAQEGQFSDIVITGLEEGDRSQ